MAWGPAYEDGLSRAQARGWFLQPVSGQIDHVTIRIWDKRDTNFVANFRVPVGGGYDTFQRFKDLGPLPYDLALGRFAQLVGTGLSGQHTEVLDVARGGWAPAIGHQNQIGGGSFRSTPKDYVQPTTVMTGSDSSPKSDRPAMPVLVTIAAAILALVLATWLVMRR